MLRNLENKTKFNSFRKLATLNSLGKSRPPFMPVKRVSPSSTSWSAIWPVVRAKCSFSLTLTLLTSCAILSARQIRLRVRFSRSSRPSSNRTCLLAQADAPDSIRAKFASSIIANAIHAPSDENDVQLHYQLLLNWTKTVLYYLSILTLNSIFLFRI